MADGMLAKQPLIAWGQQIYSGQQWNALELLLQLWPRLQNAGDGLMPTHAIALSDVYATVTLFSTSAPADHGRLLSSHV